MGTLLRPIFDSKGKTTEIQILDIEDAVVYDEVGYKQPWPKRGIVHKFNGLFSFYDKVINLISYKGKKK